MRDDFSIPDVQLTPTQVAEIRRRMADPDPQFATDEQVHQLFQDLEKRNRQRP